MSNISEQITRLETAKANLKTSLEAKGVTVAADATLDAYPALVDSIPSGGGTSDPYLADIILFDYDGTILHTYSKQEFLELNELPIPPDHTSDGLTSNGWNWTLSEAKEFLQNEGGEMIDIGHLCSKINPDNKTRIYINIPHNSTEMSIYGSGIFDWGDGSSQETFTGQDVRTHTYQNTGDYCIVIENYRIQLRSQMSLVGSDSTYIANRDYVIGIILGSAILTGISSYSPVRGFKYLEFADISVNQLCDSMFAECSSLRHLFIAPNNNGKLYYQLLASCVSLEFFVLPEITISNSSYTAQYSYNLKALSLPKSFVTTTGQEQFVDCYNLIRCSKPANSTKIYRSCYALKRIPSVTTNAATEFLDNTKLLKINLEVNSSNFNGISSSGIKSIVLKNISSTPNTIANDFELEIIDFKNCSCTTLTPSMFANNYKVKTINLPNTLTSIASLCFSCCVSLQELDLPNGITSIYNNAFSNCASLKKLTIRATTPPTLSGPFYMYYPDKIYVPAESVEAYKAATNWSAYADKIQAIPTT